MAKHRKSTEIAARPEPDYGPLLIGISELLDQARRMSARTVNNILTATYWEIGRRIVEYEQRGKARAEYGEATLAELSQDLTAKHGRGFSKRNLEQMRAFYLGWESAQTPSAAIRGPGETALRFDCGQRNIADTVRNIDEGSNCADSIRRIATSTFARCSAALLCRRFPTLLVPLCSIDVGRETPCPGVL